MGVLRGVRSSQVKLWQIYYYLLVFTVGFLTGACTTCFSMSLQRRIVHNTASLAMLTSESDKWIFRAVSADMQDQSTLLLIWRNGEEQTVSMDHACSQLSVSYKLS